MVAILLCRNVATFYSGDWAPFKLPNRINQINIKQPQTCSCGGQLWQTQSFRAELIDYLFDRTLDIHLKNASQMQISFVFLSFVI